MADKKPAATRRRSTGAAGTRRKATAARPKTQAAAAKRVPADTEESTPVLPTPEQDLKERRLEKIAIRAREIYEARGGEHGQDLDDWLQAEREIDSAMEEPLEEEEE